MTGMPSAKDLPYRLPTTTNEQLRELAKILDVPFAMVEPTGEQGLAAMSMTIMYRHLDRRQRYDAMQVIHSMENKELVNRLQTKAVDTALVNKRWGIWSMSNEELTEDQEFHELFQQVGALIGVTFSASSLKDFVREVGRNRRVTKGGLATVVIWLSFASSHSRLGKLNAELDRRSELRGSPFHQ